MDFNFDEWADLYKADPAAFEKKRKDVTSALIAAAPEQHRASMQYVQGRCDALREHLPPEQALQAMMLGLKEQQFAMIDALCDLNDEANKFVDVVKSVQLL